MMPPFWPISSASPATRQPPTFRTGTHSKARIRIHSQACIGSGFKNVTHLERGPKAFERNIGGPPATTLAKITVLFQSVDRDLVRRHQHSHQQAAHLSARRCPTMI